MNLIILAPAGGRKTQRIVDACAQGASQRRRLVITFTQTAQSVLNSRLYQACNPESMPDVMGWFGFLINHVIRPYAPCWQHWKPNLLISGLHFVEGQDPSRGFSGHRYYLDGEGRAYSNRIGKLAHDIIKNSQGDVVDRLERIYDEIYIDEVQDLGGNDLDILEILMRSKIDVTLVGDVRQSTLKTSRSDRRHSSRYDGIDKICWFRKLSTGDDRLASLDEGQDTWRCSQPIIDLADSIFTPGTFPSTTSHQMIPPNRHEGLFLVCWDDIPQYLSEYNPACYRHNKSTSLPNGISATNFGLCKGETVDDALIFPTQDMLRFLKGQTVNLKDDARIRFYIAVTRAKYSVAFAVKPKDFAQKDSYTRLTPWVPNS